MVNNFDELEYWQRYGKLENSVEWNNRLIKYISADDMDENSILQNEIKLKGLDTLAVPFVIRSYKQTGFKKERVQVKVSYKEGDSHQSKEELHRFTVTERY